MLYTPLEQFQIISLFSLKLSCLDVSITNLLLINFVAVGSFLYLILMLSSENNCFFIVPNSWQILVELIHDTTSQMLYDNINEEGEKYFPFISVLFCLILILNLVGLIPYSFTTTSHIIITLTLSFSVFIGVNVICIKRHKLKILSLFIPANTSFLLALLLVPIEFLSYLFKPISLGVRLFANLMAGHTLLKVIVGFSWSMLLIDDLLFSSLHIAPLLILVILMGLELGVAIVQSYVFITLTCIYLNDSVNLH